ncbi:MAG: hypothetical protein KGK44_01000 [Gammaproteobacteria bacterium]|nr:hypothetical protein [Gammaproteobacteria bacterium]
MAGLEGKLPNGHAPGRMDIHLIAIHNIPSRSTQQAINGVSRLGFGIGWDHGNPLWLGWISPARSLVAITIIRHEIVLPGPWIAY